MSLLRELLVSQPMGSGPGYDAFRRSHNIKGSAGGAQANYQVKIKVLYGGESSVLDHVTHIGHYEGPPANPIIAEGAVAAWDHGIREIGNILYEPADTGREYKAFYTGFKSSAERQRKIGYAYSPDGINWTKSASNPVITHATTYYEDPYVIKVGDIYYLFCERNTPNDTIVMFSSADCETWTAVGSETEVIPLGAGGSWEDLLTGSPVVWKEGATWYMLYEGMKSPGPESGIGLATSPDGVNWTKDPANPVISVPASSTGFYAVVACDDIAKVDGTYYLSIHGGFGNAAIPYATGNTGFATSTDLYTWTLPGADDIMVYPDVTTGPYNAVNNAQFYWDIPNNEWVIHYCAARIADVGRSGGETNGIYRGYPRCTGDMFVCLNGKCRTDFGDVRFRQGEIELDYWIQKKVDSDYAIFWVEVPMIPVAPGSVTIHIYYGDAASTTTEDGAATWIEYEDWESYAIGDTGPWGVFSKFFTGVEQTAKIDNNRAYKGAQSLFLDDNSDTEDNQIKWDYADKGAGGFRFLLAIYEDTDYGSGAGHGLNVYDNVPDKVVTLTYQLTFGVGDYDGAWNLMFHFIEDTWNISEMCIVIGAGTWDFRYNGLLVSNRGVRAAIGNLDYLDLQFAATPNKFKGNLGVCLVGKYVDPEPTHEDWGAEEPVAWPF